MQNNNNVNDELFLTREMIKDICDWNTYPITPKPQKGLQFLVCNDLAEIMKENIDNRNLTYEYEENPNILIVENRESHMTEVYSRKPLKVVFSEEDEEGLFENVFLTRLCLANLDFTQVKSMSNWFCCARIDTVDFSKVETPNLMDMSSMFMCSEINQIIWGKISTSYVTNMSEMFAWCEIPELSLSIIQTTRVEDMSEMFRHCLATKIDCSGFDTRNVRNMDSMFFESGVEELDLSGFITTKVTNMDLMFSDCALKFLNIKNFDMTNVESYMDMFFGCEAKVISKDKTIREAYKEDTEKEINVFDYKDLADIFTAKIENLDVGILIIEKIMSSTRCKLIKHLWGLSAHELCYEVGLENNEIEMVLNEMEKIANVIETGCVRLMSHIERCREKLLQKREL